MLHVIVNEEVVVSRVAFPIIALLLRHVEVGWVVGSTAYTSAKLATHTGLESLTNTWGAILLLFTIILGFKIPTTTVSVAGPSASSHPSVGAEGHGLT